MDATETAESQDVSSPLLFGQGQAAWLALVTVVATLALVVAVVAVFMASGDGGGGSAAPAGVSDSLTVVATEFAFDPADVTVPAGVEVPVEMENAGAVDHNWKVLSAEIGSESEFDESLVLGEVPDVPAGETASGSVTVEAGTYQVICTIAGHFEAGMVGTLTAQ